MIDDVRKDDFGFNSLQVDYKPLEKKYECERNNRSFNSLQVDYKQ